MFIFNKQIFSKPDDIFKKLLDVVPQSLSREETRIYLKEFKFDELPQVEGVQADLFFRPNCFPTNVMYVSYGTRNKAITSTLNIGYPALIWKIVWQAHRKQMFKKLDFVLDEKFGRRINSNNVVYWQKGFTIVGKNLRAMKKEFKGALYITIESFDTRIFPMDVAFEKLNYKD
jgi:hypothetical protein